MPRGLHVVDRFAPETEALREVFDKRFADPRDTRDDRFVWDYWHVPGQYTALRTPAWTYFPKGVYERFHRRLVAWGRETLGCHDISPPWLSLYVDGCRQELHGDLPHGPWAFVFSLTNWRGRTFRGGETLLVRDEVLDFWHDFRSTRAVEEGQLIRAVEPKLGRLVAFDPRIPHGVREVTGTRDPREGRLVIHGWFVQPRPFVQGALTTAALATRIAELTGKLGTWIEDLPLAGMLAVTFAVGRSGAVRGVRALSDTTRVPREHEHARRWVIRRIVLEIKGWTFGSQRGASTVTLPLVFERG
ncbi:MAG: 2OG-Fe(II) oxygenase [Deltaproteobacteria bacterium]|nr:2OG-Fe(II) oxygenase [Deltaproteobacteria bacterium]